MKLHRTGWVGDGCFSVVQVPLPFFSSSFLSATAAENPTKNLVAAAVELEIALVFLNMVPNHHQLVIVTPSNLNDSSEFNKKMRTP